MLVHPGLHVPTPSVYRALGTVGYPPVAPCPALGDGEQPPWRNDLTAAALHVCPELAAVREALAGSGGEPLLCGSGSCWVARYASISQRDAALRRLGEVPDWRCWAIG